MTPNNMTYDGSWNPQMALIYCKTTGYFDNRLPIPKGIIRYGLYGEAKTRNGSLKPIRRMPNAASAATPQFEMAKD